MILPIIVVEIILRSAIDHILRTDPDLSAGTVDAYYILHRALRAVIRGNQEVV